MNDVSMKEYNAFNDFETHNKTKRVITLSPPLEIYVICEKTLPRH